MAKREGNFFTLRDLLAKGWTGREVRYALLSAHYRDPLNFTFDGLQAARSALQRMDEFLLKLQEVSAELLQRQPAELVAAFDTALDDDLNISAALGALFEFIREANKRTIAPGEAAGILAAWRRFDEVLGFGISAKSEVPPEVQQLVEERQAARKAKNFKRSDEIRDQLAKLGWTIEDTPTGPRAKRLR
jgi:cysteinyl-tRNA synthetase